jgi:hypothetical protein
MIEREVWLGTGRAEGEEMVWKVFDWIVTVGLRGFRGVTGSEWRRYQAKTGIWMSLDRIVGTE